MTFLISYNSETTKLILLQYEKYSMSLGSEMRSGTRRIEVVEGETCESFIRITY